MTPQGRAPEERKIPWPARGTIAAFVLRSPRLPMLHPIALGLAMAVAFGLAVDLLGHRARRRALAPFGWMAVVVALWSGGELLLVAAETPGEVIGARRLLFLGPCFFSPLWLWAAWSAAGEPLDRRRRAILWTTAALEAVAYSFLWWDESGRFMDWYARPPERGPVFLAHALLAWSATAVGFVTWLTFAIRAAHAGWLPRIAAVGAALVPFAANVVYLGLGVPDFDPTPLALVAVGLVFRAVVLGGTFAPYFVSFAREELLDQIDAGILVADVTGRVVEANAAALRLTGVTRAEGEDLERLLSRARSRAGEALVCREFELHRRAAVAGRGAVLVERGSDRHREQDLELGRRLAGLGFLAAGVAHEINRPLGSLRGDLGSVEAILDQLGQASPDGDPIDLARRSLAREGIDLVQESREGLHRIEQTMSLVSGLANRQHGRDGKVFSIVESAAQAVDLARLGQASRVRMVQDGVLPRVRVVRENVVEILLQLLTNALESDEGGVIEMRLFPAAGGATVEVRDRGPGIPEAELAHVFDPFFTTKSPDRRGLGLSFAQELARRHGGRLSVANRDEGGACFRLWLPAAED
jgi:signal transduction histidine kinase